MLILGVYPNQFPTSGKETALQAIERNLDGVLSPDTALHLLPLWEASGDGGFAVNSWNNIDRQFGSERDLQKITGRWKTYIDGIFNHVGWGHPFAVQFLNDPEKYSNLLHTLKGTEAPTSPEAPRGGSMYRTVSVGSEDWQVWQTFGAQAADINLKNPIVFTEVLNCLKNFARLGMHGVRLDALAYYGKDTSNTPVHNLDGVKIAKEIISAATELGLETMLQIDCDRHLPRYLSDYASKPIVVDYAYSAHFVFSVLFERADFLADHLNSTIAQDSFDLIRPVRTHDGVLFRSENLEMGQRAKIEDYLKENNLQSRVTNGSLYENNNSLAHLFNADRGLSTYYRKLRIGLLVSEFTAAHSYCYAGSLFADHPELDTKFTADPRSLQRRQIPNQNLSPAHFAFAQSVASEVSTATPQGPLGPYECSAEGTVLVINNFLSGKVLFVNLSQHPATVQPEGKLLGSDGYNGNALEGFGHLITII